MCLKIKIKSHVLPIFMGAVFFVNSQAEAFLDIQDEELSCSYSSFPMIVDHMLDSIFYTDEDLMFFKAILMGSSSENHVKVSREKTESSPYIASNEVNAIWMATSSDTTSIDHNALVWPLWAWQKTMGPIF